MFEKAKKKLYEQQEFERQQQLEQMLMDACKRYIDSFNSEFPVGTMFKSWYKGQEYDTTFGYVSSPAFCSGIDVNVSLMSDEFIRGIINEDASPVFFYYTPVDIRESRKNKEERMFGEGSFCIHDNRTFVKTTFEEYKKYLLDKYNKSIEEDKEEIKRKKELIRENKKYIRTIDSDLKKTEEFALNNFKNDLKKRKGEM